jgi:copper transport protein
MHAVRRMLAVVAGVAVLAALTILPALAHAHYASSDPAAGATVTAAPKQVKVVFDEEPSPSKSTIMVVDATGARADAGDGKVDQSDPDRKTMVVSLKSGLGNGVYTVKYHTVTEDDGGIVDGQFSFGVNAPVPAGQAKAQDKESGGDMAAGGKELPNTGSADVLNPLPLLLAGLLLLGGGAVLRLRRSALSQRP